MGHWTATAPGKAVLLGEYAVLDGAPALVLAVDRRCRVELVECSAADCRVETPQLARAPARFRLGDGGRVGWAKAPSGGFAQTAALIEALLDGIVRGGGVVRPFRLRVDSAELFQAGQEGQVKLGLGSSAATAVAIDEVLQRAFAADYPAAAERDTAHRRLLAITRAAQGGAGSGLDLAASRLGGLLAYRVTDAGWEIETMDWPPALRTCFVWAGAPASTASLVAAWRRAGEREPKRWQALSTAMRESAEAGVEAARKGDSGAICASLAEYGRFMGKMNNLVGQPVVTPEHEAAARLAQSLGGVYKPCGAGGGDVGVAAAATDPGFPVRFAEACREAGLVSLDLFPEPIGVQSNRE